LAIDRFARAGADARDTALLDQAVVFDEPNEDRAEDPRRRALGELALAPRTERLGGPTRLDGGGVLGAQRGVDVRARGPRPHVGVERAGQLAQRLEEFLLFQRHDCLPSI